MLQPRSKPAEQSASRAQKITRETAAAWWCPICDHSQTQLIDRCGGCGADRDGDRVTPKA